MAVVTKSYSTHDEARSAVAALKANGFAEDDISLIAGGIEDGETRSQRSMDEMARRETDLEIGDPLAVDPLVGSTLGGTIAGRTISGAGADPEYARGDAPLDERPAASGTSSAAEDAAIGATSGTILGGGAGLLAGLGMMAIPGLGPVVAAGWLAATATGALIGAAAGGATGGLIGALMESGVPAEDSEVYAENVKRGGAIVSVRVAEEDKGRADAILNEHAPIDPVITGTRYRNAGWSGFDADGGTVPFNPNPPAI